MSYHLQNSNRENGFAVVANLVHLLRLKVATGTIKSIVNMPHYPSLQSFADFFDQLNVRNMSVRLSTRQLNEIPFPAIAHFHKHNGHFVVLTKVFEGNIEYIDPETGRVSQTLSDFEKNWTGVVFLVEPDAQSGEPGYEKKKHQEFFKTAGEYSAMALLVACLLLPLAFFSLPVLALFGVKAFGAALCFVLLQKQWGNTSKRLNSLCSWATTKSGCDAVLRSDGAKLGGVISVAEVGLMYFAGGLITLLFSALGSIDATGILTVAVALALPATILSVYYQGFTLKAWCPLCLLVVVSVWTEAAILWNSSSIVSLTAIPFLVAFAGFSLPVLFWLAVRSRFLDSFKIQNLEKSLMQFSKSERLFKLLLHSQPLLETTPFDHEVTIGNDESPVQLLIVSNPTCGPCRQAHQLAEYLLQQAEGNVGVRIRFVGNLTDQAADSHKMLKHLFSLQITETRERVWEALSRWYNRSPKENLLEWMKAHPTTMQIEDDDLELLFNEHKTWALEAGIQGTPTIFIQGRRVPEEFSVSDVKYHLLKMVKETEAQETAA